MGDSLTHCLDPVYYILAIFALDPYKDQNTKIPKTKSCICIEGLLTSQNLNPKP